MLCIPTGNTPGIMPHDTIGCMPPGIIAPGCMPPGIIAPGCMAPGIIAPGIMAPGMQPAMPPGMPQGPGAHGSPPEREAAKAVAALKVPLLSSFAAMRRGTI